MDPAATSLFFDVGPAECLRLIVEFLWESKICVIFATRGEA